MVLQVRFRVLEIAAMCAHRCLTRLCPEWQIRAQWITRSGEWTNLPGDTTTPEDCGLQLQWQVNRERAALHLDFFIRVHVRVCRCMYVCEDVCGSVRAHTFQCEFWPWNQTFLAPHLHKFHRPCVYCPHTSSFTCYKLRRQPGNDLNSHYEIQWEECVSSECVSLHVYRPETCCSLSLSIYLYSAFSKMSDVIFYVCSLCTVSPLVCFIILCLLSCVRACVSIYLLWIRGSGEHCGSGGDFSAT